MGCGVGVAMAERIKAVRNLHEGVISLRMVTLEMDDGSVAEREVVDHPAGATILLYHEQRRTALLVSELRAPLEYAGAARMLEAVGGTIDDGDAETCIRREAEEEAGVRVRAVEHVARLWPTLSSSTEHVDYFLAAYDDSDRVGRGGGLPEEHETLKVRELPLAEAWAMAERGALQDAKTFTLLCMLRIRRPDLFD